MPSNMSARQSIHTSIFTPYIFTDSAYMKERGGSICWLEKPRFKPQMISEGHIIGQQAPSSPIENKFPRHESRAARKEMQHGRQHFFCHVNKWIFLLLQVIFHRHCFMPCEVVKFILMMRKISVPNGITDAQ